MFAQSQENRSLFRTVLGWCRAQGTSECELGFFDKTELEQLARDVRMPVSELWAVSRRGPKAADLLLRRMTALDLDPNEVSRTEPETFRDLQRLCTLCRHHRRCARDFDREAATEVWDVYCPNTGTLAALNAQPWAARREW
jgi:hypothetical protein